jgi:hypothetical protein
VGRKDLSRTVIEGGRYYHNCWFRRASHGVARARTRAWLDEVRADPEAADDGAPRELTRVRKAFRDKLAPARKWLAAQCGRPWTKVYGDLCARFDTRTVAGRHVVHDHMLPWVWHGDEHVPDYRRYDFIVDGRGILRDSTWGERRTALLAWTGGRLAAKTYWGWWWFAPYEVRAPGTYVVTDRYHVPLARMTRGDVRRIERVAADLRREVVMPARALVLR